MDVQQVIKLGLLLLSKREQIGDIIADGIALWKKVKTALPDIGNQFEAAAGSKSSAPDYSVKWLQESLNKLADAGLKADGQYGDATRTAVKKFQEAYGLEADGWAGALTQAAIAGALEKH